MFDIVVLVGPNDVMFIQKHIKATRDNVIGYRNIYIVTPHADLHVEGCTIINESIFPFTIASVQAILGKNERTGWYLQQLLKLYAGRVIPGILGRYLVVDSDVFFKKPITFVENDVCLYATGTEHWIPYFEHMQRLHPTLVRQTNNSGIVHHMMFETRYIEELFQLVKTTHPTTEFWEVFLKSVSPRDILGSGASEYEIYFNYMLRYHPTQIRIRPLNWTNSSTVHNYKENYDFLAVHWYIRV